MTEKKYLKWYNKIGYGSGDIAGNVVYAFLTFFLMIYLTDTVGLNAGIIGTLMMGLGMSLVMTEIGELLGTVLALVIGSGVGIVSNCLCMSGIPDL